MSMFNLRRSATSTDTGGQILNAVETQQSTSSESQSESPATPVPDSTATTESFTMVDANISDTDYAQKCKELMALHSDLSVVISTFIRAGRSCIEHPFS
jgi:hypothetical protein